MAIPASCVYCDTKIHLQASATGKKVRCPSCSGVNQIGALRDGVYRLIGEEGEEATMLQEDPNSFEAPPRRAAPVPRGRRSGARTPAQDQGTTPFVMGLIGLLACQILCPVAWIMGNSYRDQCRARNEIPNGLGEAGRIMGMIGTFFLLVPLIFIFIFVFIGAASGGGF
jgi:hypothetical protein